ncbi:MAG: ABC transporter ATP-binding protein, partial [Gammaproteobacteria bacterium]|nr:ABC transporter ATP-binding protein [Gammaproteobacteria bacterium]
RAAAEHRARLKPLRDEIRRIEKALERDQALLTGIEHRLADESLYADGDNEALTELLREQGELRGRIATAEEDWLHASARYEGQAQGDEV